MKMDAVTFSFHCLNHVRLVRVLCVILLAFHSRFKTLAKSLLAMNRTQMYCTNGILNYFRTYYFPWIFYLFSLFLIRLRKNFRFYYDYYLKILCCLSHSTRHKMIVVCLFDVAMHSIYLWRSWYLGNNKHLVGPVLWL